MSDSTIPDTPIILNEVINKCTLAGWPVDDPQCRHIIIAVGKIALEAGASVTQPATISPTPVPDPTPITTPTPTTTTTS